MDFKSAWKIVFVLSIAFGFCNGQNQFLAGPKIGINNSNISSESQTSLNNPRLGVNVGLFSLVPIKKDKLYISSDLLFNQKGSKIEYQQEFSKIRLNYLELQIMPSLRLFKRLHAQGGIYFSRLINARRTKTNIGQPRVDVDVSDRYQNFEHGYILGLSYYFIDHQYVGIRFSQGLSEIMILNTPNLSRNTNILFQVYAGINFYKSLKE